jgi:hypothetical protein
MAKIMFLAALTGFIHHAGKPVEDGSSMFFWLKP